MILGDDGNWEDFTELGPYLSSSCVLPTPLSCFPVFYQSEVLVEMVLFLRSTFGCIFGLSGFLCFNLSLLMFLAILPKIHLFLQTEKMLAYQTNSDPAIEKLQSLRVASLSAGIGSYQSPNLALGSNKASGSQLLGNSSLCERWCMDHFCCCSEAWLCAILNFSFRGNGKFRPRV